MIFKGEPNHYVRFANKTVVRLTGKKGFYFDENGRYKTENELLIKVLKQHFEVEEASIEQPTKKYHCKKCDFTTDNTGELMAHYRKEHPKKS